MPRIFLSYRREDSSGHAGRLYDALAARFGENNVFMDVDAIDAGVDFAEAIDTAVRSSDVLIALIGRNWLSASGTDGNRRLDDPHDYVRIELESALARKIRVVPACVQGAEIPAAGDLPATLTPLTQRQGIELRDVAWHDDVERLVRQLAEHADQQTRAEIASAPAEPLERRPRWFRPRRRVLAIGLTIVALGAGAAALAITLGGSSNHGTAPLLARTPAERRLLAAIPLIIRSSCQRISWGPSAALVSVGCSATRLSVDYYLFNSLAVLNAWYVQSREAANVDPLSGSCAADAFRGEARYTVGARTVGREFCFFDKNSPRFDWTDTRVGVGVEVFSERTDRRAAESLLRQWRCCLELQESARTT